MSFKLPTPESIELTDPLVIENNRRMTPAEKIARICECNEFVRARIAGHLMTRHPEWTESQIQAEVARRILRDAV